MPIPLLAEVKEQIDANRRFQGPGGGLQIAGGDVADAYWRSGRQDELTEIVRYSVQSGLVPTLMTHGQTDTTTEANLSPNANRYFTREGNNYLARGI